MLTTMGMIVITNSLIMDKRINLIPILWETLMTNFGGNLTEYETRKSSYKMIMFVTLLGGIVIWMGYQASLTVDLSVSEPKLPFNDLEGLLNSDWNLFTINKK